MLVAVTIPNAFYGTDVKMTSDFSFIVIRWRSHCFFDIRETSTLVSRHNIPEVKFLVFNVAETAIPMWG